MRDLTYLSLHPWLKLLWAVACLCLVVVHSPPRLTDMAWCFGLHPGVFDFGVLGMIWVIPIAAHSPYEVVPHSHFLVFFKLIAGCTALLAAGFNTSLLWQLIQSDASASTPRFLDRRFLQIQYRLKKSAMLEISARK